MWGGPGALGWRRLIGSTTALHLWHTEAVGSLLVSEQNILKINDSEIQMKDVEGLYVRILSPRNWLSHQAVEEGKEMQTETTNSESLCLPEMQLVLFPWPSCHHSQVCPRKHRRNANTRLWTRVSDATVLTFQRDLSFPLSFPSHCFPPDSRPVFKPLPCHGQTLPPSPCWGRTVTAFLFKKLSLLGWCCLIALCKFQV